MCFGSKADKDDSPAPRPAQRPSSLQQQDTKMTSSNQQQPQYAPPAGPPPGQHSAQQQYAPPPGPPPSQTYTAPSGPPPGRADEFAPPSGPPPSHGGYAPPSGPPLSHQQSEYAPPPGPPPARSDYTAPPLGPPPSHNDYTAPPSGPPPSESKKHDWETAVPDTTLFPPPPAFFSGFDRSPANNSTEQEAEAGEAWVAQYPLVKPINLDASALEALRTHRIWLLQPQGFRGTMAQPVSGKWEITTQRNAPDSTIIGYPPLYSVKHNSPLATGKPFKVYYEVKIRGSASEVDLALGFTALPYPNFRLPGWHRGSLGVHGDDGHKYINDRWGGKSFTTPFQPGETLGIGMSFTAQGGRMSVEIFFTRDGRLSGSWNLHEEGDSEQDLPVNGLEGYHDLSCAIGTFSKNEYDIIFDPELWKYRP
ncbi:SPRY domain-containing protein [Colletotrichum tamarilloi]|uniref:SPRY domain-containing protein n=1 Tax=Colletotrichum tamarilloi TaxID=1209934 RepID=A0ABQ9RQR0_9PEZI|nr:SPRY domain-containing protein [Colletotrichum tamarilloi]KAK1510681.1 SPRY domain-containing protein [Colletotrichum tamarilloi]